MTTRKKKKSTEGLRYRPEKDIYERFEYIDGKRRSFSAKDPDEVWEKIRWAKDEKTRLEEERALGPSFKEVAERYRSLVYEMKYGTQKTYLPAISRAIEYFGELRIKDIEVYEISTFLSSLGNVSRTTVSNQKTVLNSIWQIYIEDPVWRGKVNTAKMATMPRRLKKTKRLPPTDEQIRIVKDHYMDPEALPAVMFLCTGERKGEALAIRLKDIDFEKKLIDISRAIKYRNNRPIEEDQSTKTDAGVRKIPLLPMLEEALAPLRNLPEDTYVIGGKLEPVSESAYKRMWERFWRKHGIATPIERTKTVFRRGRQDIIKYTDWKVDVCAHQFRHEYVCMLCEAGVPEEVSILMVGHANARMIHEVYLALKPAMVASDREKLVAYMTSSSGT